MAEGATEVMEGMAVGGKSCCVLLESGDDTAHPASQVMAELQYNHGLLLFIILPLSHFNYFLLYYLHASLPSHYPPVPLTGFRPEILNRTDNPLSAPQPPLHPRGHRPQGGKRRRPFKSISFIGMSRFLSSSKALRLRLAACPPIAR
jgi:hypothetical protein